MSETNEGNEDQLAETKNSPMLSSKVETEEVKDLIPKPGISKPDSSQELVLKLSQSTGSGTGKRSRWRLVGSAIIISIACIDPGNLQGGSFLYVGCTFEFNDMM